MRKLRIISLLLILSIVFCSCGNSKKISQEESTTYPNAKISTGVNKLGNDAIKAFDEYKNASINKNEIIEKIKNIYEQISDIADIDNNFDDFYVENFVEELYEKLQNEICDMDDYKLPYEDLKSVLAGNYTSSSYTETYEIGDIYFHLTDEWKQTDDDAFSLNGTMALSTYPYEADSSIALLFADNVEDLIKEYKKSEGIDINDWGVYKSRNLNYFYTLNGSYKDMNVLIAFVEGYKNKTKYRFTFSSYDEMDEKIIHDIFDTVPYIQ